MTRRALLGAGAIALAGCGPPEQPETVPADVLNEQLRLSQAAEAAYAGVAGAAALRIAAAARVARLEAAVRSAGGTPVAAPAAAPTGLDAALVAERAALRGHVAAIGRLGEREWRELLGELVAGTAAAESAVLVRLDHPPLTTAFPGQPVA